MKILWTEKTRAAEQGVEDGLAAFETMLVAFLGRIGLWLSPTPSAIMVSRAAKDILDIGWLWAIILAFVVEMVGLACSSLVLRGYEWNRTKTQKDAKANVELAIILLVGYFVVTIALLASFAVVAISHDTTQWPEFISILLPGLSAISVLAMNERMQQHRREAEQAIRRAELKRNRAEQGGTKTEPERNSSGTVAEQVPLAERAAELLAEQPELSGTELGNLLGVSASYGRRLRRKLEKGKAPR